MLAIFSLLLVNLIYILQQNNKLEGYLADRNDQCATHKQDLVDSYEHNLDIFQQEIDRRIVMEKNTESLSADYRVPQPQRKTNDISNFLPEDFDISLSAIVAKKYYFLLMRLNNEPDKKAELETILHSREKIALKIKDGLEFADESGTTKEDIWELESQLENIDYQIELILDEEHAQRFTMLKNSDEEQKQFNQYTLGIAGLFPLNGAQQESVLFTRLKHKQDFEEKMNALDIDMEFPLTSEQRDSLKKDVEMAVMHYKHGFLMEIRNELDHDNFPMDQYTLLENYVNTEFQEMINNLRAKIDKRQHVN